MKELLKPMDKPCGEMPGKRSNEHQQGKNYRAENGRKESRHERTPITVNPYPENVHGNVPAITGAESPHIRYSGIDNNSGGYHCGDCKNQKAKTLILPAVKTPHGRKREYTRTGLTLRPFCALHRAGIYGGTGNVGFSAPPTA